MIIKILGSGCNNCVRLEANARKAAEELGITAEFVKVKEMADIAAYGVMRTPGLVVDEKVVSFGKVLSPEDIKPLITK
uniref:Redox-active disulfide protein 2 n=1 Tax=uncultured bacterium pAB4 TaxID=1444979 RepID=W5VKB7_9BACT|nr:redox-active disulfide protein 2 [uncultured bacterium pAB4]